MSTINLWVRIILVSAILIAFCMGIGYAISGNVGAIMGLAFVSVCILYGAISTANETKTQHTANGDWFHLAKVKMHSSLAQEVFDYYKKIILESKLKFSDVLKNVDLRREYNKIKKIQNSLLDDNDMTYIDALDTSFCGFIDNAEPDGLILNPKEKCLFSTKSAELKTIQKICTNYSYSGFRFNNDGFRYGNITMYPTQVEGLKHFDDGNLVLTNQRIIFKGNNMRTKTIPIGSIMGIENFENDGIIIFLSNREKPIVIKFLADKRFFYNKVHNVAFFHNDLNDFYYYFDKVLYERLVPKDVQELRKETDEVNSRLAHMKMVSEGLEEEIK